MYTGSSSFLRNFVLVVLAMAGGRFVRENPLLFGLPAASMPFVTTTTTTEQQQQHDVSFPAIITSHPVLDAVLKHHTADIVGDDYEAYRNHCLRVMNFAVYYHGVERQNCQPPATPTSQPLPNDPATATSSSSMSEQELNIVALGVAYHDIGLWTPNGGALDYLEPSVAVLEQEIYATGGAKKKRTKQQAWASSSLPAFTVADLATAREIILQHHKFTAWRQPVIKGEENGVNNVDAALVNAVRRADWADATMGIVKSGMSPIYLETVYKAIPALGFHGMLLGMCSRLSPNSLIGQLDVLRILKW